jgi:hypothetical protein
VLRGRDIERDDSHEERVQFPTEEKRDIEANDRYTVLDVAEIHSTNRKIDTRGTVLFIL